MDKIFKAKRLDDGEWVEFDLMTPSSDGVDSFKIFMNRELIHLDKNTICQYTGINDKYGNKIFEGDEVKGYEHEPDSPYIVRYHAGKYSCGFVAADNEDCNPYINIWYDGLTLTVKNIHDD